MNAFDMIYRMLDDHHESWITTMANGMEYDEYQKFVGRMGALRLIQQDIKDIESRIMQDEE